MDVDERRVFILKEGREGPGPVIYWMSRDQRAYDNWALIYARQLAAGRKVPLGVVFCLAPDFLGATFRQYGFMLRGLKEVEAALSSMGIPFMLLKGRPEEKLPGFARARRASVLVTDFDPLRIKLGWKKAVCASLDIPVHEVDAHNIVPCRAASDKAEYAAYTLRPKIRRLLPRFLSDFPPKGRRPRPWQGRVPRIDWAGLMKSVHADRSVGEVGRLAPGPSGAARTLRHFLKSKLPLYARYRNDPTADACSNLSPYLHFGSISAQRVALQIELCDAPREPKLAFLEELIVRRELSDNFCLMNPDYDRFEGFPAWARKTLDEHRKDRRPYTYTLRELESAATRDELWNAAQNEMLILGKMHGYMRMYWAKKILEWSESPEDALHTAIYLNDRYELDGRDPNGYAGIAWSIGGVHDRAWGERPVFGKVRFMSERGARAKFDADRYIRRIRSLAARPRLS